MTEAALLAGICAHPDDDTPRLVYADWLDENGRPEEAEMIRVQCRLDANGPHDPDYAELLVRLGELEAWLGAHRPGPSLKLRGGLTINDESEWWTGSRRGFPRCIFLSGAGRARGTFAKRAGAALAKLFARLPTRWLIVSEVSPAQLADLLREPVIERLERLGIAADLNSDDQADELARLIAAAPTLRTLGGLLLGFAIGEAGVAALAEADFPRMDLFSADPTRFTAADLHTLGRADWFRNLRQLALDEGLADEALTALAGCEPFPQLHSLGLRHHYFAVPSWEAFVRSRAFPALASLDLLGTDLSRGRATMLARAKGLALRHLDLQLCSVGNDGAAALSRAAWAGSLRILNLSGNRISAVGARVLARSPRLANLRHLELMRNPLREQGLRELARSRHLRRLTTLGVGGPRRIDGADFVAHLDLPELRCLTLDQITLGAAGAKILADHPRFAQLTRLRLPSCALGDDGAAALIAAPQLQNMIELDFADNGIATGVAALTDRSVMPQLSICRLYHNPLAPELAKKLRRRPGFAV